MVRRWNCWGDTEQDYPLSKNMLNFVISKVGKSTPLKNASLEEVIAKVPPSRLPSPLKSCITTDPATRIRHACGQSIPDLLSLHSGNFAAFPDGVALPETTEEVRELLCWAKNHQVDVMPYGGGTSVVGHVTLTAGCPPTLTISLEKINRLLDLNRESRLARFGAGVTGTFLEEQLDHYGYILGHYPQSFEYSTLGGWIATRSSGQQSLYYGRIEALFAGGLLETFDGPLTIKPFPASAAGLDFRELVLGSEGRFGIITEAVVRISPKPEKEDFYTIFFPSFEDGIKALQALIQSEIRFSMLRLSNAKETEAQLMLADHPFLLNLLEKWLNWKGIKQSKCMLMLGITGSNDYCARAKTVGYKTIKKYGGVSIGSFLGKKWKQSRFRAPYLRENLWNSGYIIDTLETACNWEQVDKMVPSIESALTDACKDVYAFTHLSHIYIQGSSIYTTYLFKMDETYEKTLEKWQQLKSAASKAIVTLGGTISHQHGVGKDHRGYLSHEKGELGISVLRSLCDVFDPDHLFARDNLVKSESSHVE